MLAIAQYDTSSFTMQDYLPVVAGGGLHTLRYVHNKIPLVWLVSVYTSAMFTVFLHYLGRYLTHFRSSILDRC